MSIELPASRHSAEECATAFEWLREQALGDTFTGDAAGVVLAEWGALALVASYREFTDSDVRILQDQLERERDAHRNTAKQLADVQTFASACVAELEELREQVKADDAREAGDLGERLRS